jgi:hypothetical protein
MVALNLCTSILYFAEFVVIRILCMYSPRRSARKCDGRGSFFKYKITVPPSILDSRYAMDLVLACSRRPDKTKHRPRPVLPGRDGA